MFTGTIRKFSDLQPGDWFAVKPLEELLEFDVYVKLKDPLFKKSKDFIPCNCVSLNNGVAKTFMKTATVWKVNIDKQ